MGEVFIVIQEEIKSLLGGYFEMLGDANSQELQSICGIFDRLFAYFSDVHF